MKKTIFLILFYLFNCELFTIANQSCSNYNSFGYCTEIKKHLPKFEAFRPKGLRVTIADTPGLQSVSFKGNINKRIERDHKGDVHFNLEKKNGVWTHYIENVDLKVGSVINFFLKVREHNNEINYEKKRIFIKSLEPSPFIKTPTIPQNRPNFSTNQKPGTCTCCPTGGHGGATATATATVIVSQPTQNRPTINQNTQRKPNNPPPQHPPTRQPSNQQIKHTTPAARPALTTTTKSPQQQFESTGAGEVTNNNEDTSSNFCRVSDLIEMVVKLEKAETKIDSLTEVLEYLLSETKIVNGKKLFYSLSKPPGPTDNALYTIQSVLGDTLDMMDLENEIQKATYVDGGILFEVKNNIEKLRILFRARQVLISSINKITDPEPTSTTNLIDIISKPTTVAPSVPSVTNGDGNYDQLFQNIFNQPSGTEQQQQQQQPSNSDIDESFWRLDEVGNKVPPKKTL